jgi:hypothetical protein
MKIRYNLAQSSRYFFFGETPKWEPARTFYESNLELYRTIYTNAS